MGVGDAVGVTVEVGVGVGNAVGVAAGAGVGVGGAVGVTVEVGMGVGNAVGVAAGASFAEEVWGVATAVGLGTVLADGARGSATDG